MMIDIPPNDMKHRGIGVVVSNDQERINVLWDHGCEISFCTYRIKELNPNVVKAV